jgi:hypothetical protein
MFAKLTGYAQTLTESRFVAQQMWTQLSWVETAREAEKLSRQGAEKLVGELNEKHPGPEYTIERDENGMNNVPPYGLDNFVVKKMQKRATVGAG